MKKIFLLLFVLIGTILLRNNASAQCIDTVQSYPPVVQNGFLPPAFWGVNEDDSARFWGMTRRFIDNGSGPGLALWVSSDTTLIPQACMGVIFVFGNIPVASLRYHEAIHYQGFMMNKKGEIFGTAIEKYSSTTPKPQVPRKHPNPEERRHFDLVSANGVDPGQIDVARLGNPDEETISTSFDDIKVFATDNLSFKVINPIGQPLTITVYDMAGRQVGDNISVVGMYLIQIKSSEASKVERLFLR